MTVQGKVKVDTTQIKEILEKNKRKMKFSLEICARCTLCAESCFLYNFRGKDPRYMPSYKFIHSIGTLYKKKGNVDRAILEEIGVNVFSRCVLCTRCYCPFGIDIPDMLALARRICRSQGVYRRYD